MGEAVAAGPVLADDPRLHRDVERRQHVATGIPRIGATTTGSNVVPTTDAVSST